ncbi:hypothetical protein LTR08_006758 [Meristemomyces frigidus]|nr:hypothetical protein LTR08_006758 [Meristemomyces frigidus]
MRINDVYVNQLFSMLAKLTLSTLLVGQIVGAAIIPRQASIDSVTNVVTHTIYAPAVVTSIHTIYYTPTSFEYSPTASALASHASPAAAGLNPIHGLPVPAQSSSTSTDAPRISIIPVTPTTRGAPTGWPKYIPYVFPSSHSVETHQSAPSVETPKPTSPTSSPPTPTTSSKHSKATITLFSLHYASSHTHSSTHESSKTRSTHHPASTDDSQGMVGKDQ